MMDCKQITPDLLYVDSNRAKKLKEQYKIRFGTDAQLVVRSPGRVNIIGEHIDYCGYAVLPMAVENDIIVAGSPNVSNTLTIYNENSHYSEIVLEITDATVGPESIIIDPTKAHWSNYCLAAIKGILVYCENEQIKIPDIRYNLFVEGTIPHSSGLSSSSALVCATALFFVVLYKLPITLNKLAKLCATSEKYVGTEGGGMDQAISLLATKNTAKLIHFNPLTTTDVMLPNNLVFVIANSCVESSKVLSSSTHFNKRVVECKLAVLLLSHILNIDIKLNNKLKDVQEKSGKTIEEMIEIVKKNIKKEQYTLNEIADITNIKLEELIKLCGNVDYKDKFQIYNRALHVYSEADRVYSFYEICNKINNNDNNRNNEYENKLGELMNESQKSCSKLYECSCEEIDVLTEICIKSGAIGSRLTGAGWGGCTISLLHVNQVHSFILQIKEKYYKNYRNFKEEEITNKIIFETVPGEGASILLI